MFATLTVSPLRLAADRLFGGVGLGLSITRQLTEFLGGEFTFTSEETKGSVFSLIIPTGVDIGSQPSLDEAEVAGETIPANKKTPEFSGTVLALVVEDDPGCQILAAKLLEPLGLEVTIVEDGAEAIEKALERPFDLIFMDMRLPAMDGFEATGILRQKGITTPIIALTAYAMEGDRIKCLDAGCDDYLSKPIDRDKLLEMLSGYLPVKNQQPISNR